VNHVERDGLLAGHTLERFWSEYGLDLLVHTHSAEGELENGSVAMEIKATGFLRGVGDNQMVAKRVERAHLMHWLDEPEPVILVVYDVAADSAYWLDGRAVAERDQFECMIAQRNVA
jgi:hypothetical protein